MAAQTQPNTDTAPPTGNAVVTTRITRSPTARVLNRSVEEVDRYAREGRLPYVLNAAGIREYDLDGVLKLKRELDRRQRGRDTAA